MISSNLHNLKLITYEFMQFILFFIINCDHKLSKFSCKFYEIDELSFNGTLQEGTNDCEIFSHI